MAFDVQTIMIATDFSEASTVATNYGFQLARTLQARLFMVHVVPEEDIEFLTALTPRLQSQITAETLREVLYTDADKRLAAIIGQAGVEAMVEERLIVTGKPAEAIVSWAASKQPQVLILGTHRRRGVDHFIRP